MAKMMRDADGFAPTGESECDVHEDCLGWEMCYHTFTGRDADGWCEEGHPADRDAPVWIWCSERTN